MNGRSLFVLGYLSVFLFLFPREAPCSPAGFDTLDAGGEAKVGKVLDGDTLRLDDGRLVRLVGIRAPKPLPGEERSATSLAISSKRALEEIAGGASVSLYFGPRREDRHGQVLAHLVTANGLWVQGEMLKAGQAHVYSFADNRALVRQMLAIEAVARLHALGIWKSPRFSVLKADSIGRFEESFRIVEGRVKSVGERKSRSFVNFSEDWKTDFTLSLTAQSRRALEKDSGGLGDWTGRRIRVRGWLRFWNGPFMEIDHPEQVEFLDE